MKRVAKHGSLHMYANLKCRCERCVAQWNAYSKERYHARKLERSRGEGSNQPQAPAPQITQPNDLHLRNQDGLPDSNEPLRIL